MSQMIAEETKIGADWSPESWLSCRKRMSEELVRGRKLASQLQSLLWSPSSAEPRSVSGGEDPRLVLAAGILRSFSKTILAIDEICQGSVCSDLNYGDCTRRTLNKKRKVSQLRIVNSRTVEDGHGWRKYGQKKILNAKHPRCYFRCSHKSDQGCAAVKQVQRTDDDSELFRITYIGDHTCTTTPSIINTNAMAGDDPLSSSYNICFSHPDNDNNCGLHCHWPADSKEETMSGLADNLSSFDDPDLWWDVADLGNFPEVAADAECDYGDAVSEQYCFSDYADSRIFGGDFDHHFPV